MYRKMELDTEYDIILSSTAPVKTIVTSKAKITNKSSTSVEHNMNVDTASIINLTNTDNEIIKILTITQLIDFMIELKNGHEMIIWIDANASSTKSNTEVEINQEMDAAYGDSFNSTTDSECLSRRKDDKDGILNGGKHLIVDGSFWLN